MLCVLIACTVFVMMFFIEFFILIKNDDLSLCFYTIFNGSLSFWQKMTYWMCGQSTTTFKVFSFKSQITYWMCGQSTTTFSAFSFNSQNSQIRLTENIRLSVDRLSATSIIASDFQTTVRCAHYRWRFSDPCTPPIIRHSLYIDARPAHFELASNLMSNLCGRRLANAC